MPFPRWQEYEGQIDAWTFEGSWQESYLCAAVPAYRRGSKRPRPVQGVFSDLLYQPWFNTSVVVSAAGRPRRAPGPPCFL